MADCDGWPVITVHCGRAKWCVVREAWGRVVFASCAVVHGMSQGLAAQNLSKHAAKVRSNSNARRIPIGLTLGRRRLPATMWPKDCLDLEAEGV